MAYIGHTFIQWIEKDNIRDISQFMALLTNNQKVRDDLYKKDIFTIFYGDRVELIGPEFTLSFYDSSRYPEAGICRIRGTKIRIGLDKRSRLQSEALTLPEDLKLKSPDFVIEILEKIAKEKPKVVVFYNKHYPLEPLGGVVEKIRDSYSPSQILFVEFPHSYTPLGYALNSYQYLYAKAADMSAGSHILQDYTPEENKIFGKTLLKFINEVENRKEEISELHEQEFKAGRGAAMRSLTKTLDEIISKITGAITIDFKSMLDTLARNNPSLRDEEELTVKKLAEQYPNLRFISLHGQFLKVSEQFEHGLPYNHIYGTKKASQCHLPAIKKAREISQYGKWGYIRNPFISNFLRNQINIEYFDNNINYSFFELPFSMDSLPIAIDDLIKAVIGSYLLQDPYFATTGNEKYINMDYFRRTLISQAAGDLMADDLKEYLDLFLNQIEEIPIVMEETLPRGMEIPIEEAIEMLQQFKESLPLPYVKGFEQFGNRLLQAYELDTVIQLLKEYHALISKPKEYKITALKRKDGGLFIERITYDKGSIINTVLAWTLLISLFFTAYFLFSPNEILNAPELVSYTGWIPVLIGMAKWGRNNKMDKKKQNSINKIASLMKSIPKERGNLRALFTIYRDIGLEYYLIDNYVEALRYYQIAYDIMVKNNLELAAAEKSNLLYWSAINYYYMEKYNESFMCCEKALEIEPDPHTKNTYRFLISLCLFELDEYDKAEEYLKQCLKMETPLVPDSIYGMLGIIYFVRDNNKEKALEYLDKAYANVKKDSKADANKCLVEFHRARIYYLTNEPDLAWEHFNKALEYPKELISSVEKPAAKIIAHMSQNGFFAMERYLNLMKEKLGAGFISGLIVKTINRMIEVERKRKSGGGAVQNELAPLTDPNLIKNIKEAIQFIKREGEEKDIQKIAEMPVIKGTPELIAEIRPAAAKTEEKPIKYYELGKECYEKLKSGGMNPEERIALAKDGITYLNNSIKQGYVYPDVYLILGYLYSEIGEYVEVFKMLEILKEKGQALKDKGFDFERHLKSTLLNIFKLCMESKKPIPPNYTAVLRYIVGYNKLGLFEIIMQNKENLFLKHEGRISGLVEIVLIILENNDCNVVFKSRAVQLIEGLGLTEYSNELVKLLTAEFAKFKRNEKSYFEKGVELLKLCFSDKVIEFLDGLLKENNFKNKDNIKEKIQNIRCYIKGALEVNELINNGKSYLTIEEWQDVLSEYLPQVPSEWREYMLERETAKFIKEFNCLDNNTVRKGILKSREDGLEVEKLKDNLHKLNSEIKDNEAQKKRLKRLWRYLNEVIRKIHTGAAESPVGELEGDTARLFKDGQDEKKKGNINSAIEKYKEAFNRAFEDNDLKLCLEIYFALDLAYISIRDITSSADLGKGLLSKYGELLPSELLTNISIAVSEKLRYSGRLLEGIELLAKLKDDKLIKEQLAAKYLNKALCYQQMGDYDTALEIYKKCAGISPDDGRIYNNTAIIYYEKGNVPETIENIKEALKRNTSASAEEIFEAVLDGLKDGNDYMLYWLKGFFTAEDKSIKDFMVKQFNDYVKKHNEVSLLLLGSAVIKAALRCGKLTDVNIKDILKILGFDIKLDKDLISLNYDGFEFSMPYLEIAPDGPITVSTDKLMDKLLEDLEDSLRFITDLIGRAKVQEYIEKRGGVRTLKQTLLDVASRNLRENHGKGELEELKGIPLKLIIERLSSNMVSGKGLKEVIVELNCLTFISDGKVKIFIQRLDDSSEILTIEVADSVDRTYFQNIIDKNLGGFNNFISAYLEENPAGAIEIATNNEDLYGFIEQEFTKRSFAGGMPEDGAIEKDEVGYPVLIIAEPEEKQDTYTEEVISALKSYLRTYPDIVFSSGAVKKIIIGARPEEIGLENNVNGCYLPESKTIVITTYGIRNVTTLKDTLAEEFGHAIEGLLEGIGEYFKTYNNLYPDNSHADYTHYLGICFQKYLVNKDGFSKYINEPKAEAGLPESFYRAIDKRFKDIQFSENIRQERNRSIEKLEGIMKNAGLVNLKIDQTLTQQIKQEIPNGCAYSKKGGKRKMGGDRQEQSIESLERRLIGILVKVAKKVTPEMIQEGKKISSTDFAKLLINEKVRERLHNLGIEDKRINILIEIVLGKRNLRVYKEFPVNKVPGILYYLTRIDVHGKDIEKVSQMRIKENPDDKRFTILLIVPPIADDGFLRNIGGVSYLGASLNNKEFLSKLYSKIEDLKSIGTDYRVRILDLGLSKNDQGFNFDNYITSLKPNIVGVTALSQNYHEAVLIAEKVKQIVPNALRVTGGYHTAVLPEEALKETEFEVVVRNYGEETLAEIAGRFSVQGRSGLYDSLSKIDGISYKTADGQIFKNTDRKYLLGLDEYPFLHESDDLYVYSGYPQDEIEGRKLAYIYASRGCPFNCLYCAGKAITKGIVLRRSPENILKEIGLMYDKGYRLFSFRDEIFTINRKWLNEILNGLEKMKQEGKQIEWIMQTRADQLDEGLLQRMKNAGLTKIMLGIESGNIDLMRRIKNDPNLDIEKIKFNLQKAKELGIYICEYFLVGVPGQTWTDILDTANFICDTEPGVISVFTLVPYPGTEYYSPLNNGALRIEKGNITDDFNKYRSSTEEMCAEEIKCAQYLLKLLGIAMHQWKQIKLINPDIPPESEIIKPIINVIREFRIVDLIISAEQEIKRQKRSEKIRQIAGKAHNESIWSDIGELFRRIDNNRLSLPTVLNTDYDLIVSNIDVFKSIPKNVGQHFINVKMSKAHVDNFLRNIKFNSGIKLLSKLRYNETLTLIKILSSLHFITDGKIKAIEFDTEDDKVFHNLFNALDRIGVKELNEMNKCMDKLLNEFKLKGWELKFYGIPMKLSFEGKLTIYSSRIDVSHKGIEIDAPKSYTGKGGTDKEANPIIKSAFENGAQDITEEEITKQAKAILLGDERFTAKDKGFAGKSITFSSLRVIAIPALPLDGHYGMGGEINKHTLPTVYVPKKLYNYLLQRHNKGGLDAENAVWELADYLYHKYMEMRLVRLCGMTAEEAHTIVEHKEYLNEYDYLGMETYMRLKYARKRLLNIIEQMNKPAPDTGIQFPELLNIAKDLRNSGKIYEAFIKAIESLRYIMEHPLEDYDIKDSCITAAEILKIYRDLYRDESVSDKLISLLEEYSRQGGYKDLSKILTNEYREDLTARKITYQVFTRTDELIIKGMETFPLYFQDKNKYKGRKIIIEWIEETPGLWVPVKIIFHDEKGQPDSILYIKRVYDSSLKLFGLYLKIPSRILGPGMIISGARVTANTLQIAGKVFFCQGHNGAQAKVIVGDKNVFTSIHLGPSRAKRPIDIMLKIVTCRNVPLGSYIKLPQPTLSRLYEKYGELGVTNLYVSSGTKPTTPKVGNCSRYQLKGYGGSLVTMVIGEGGQILKVRIKGIKGFADIEKIPAKISQPKVLEKREDSIGEMVKIPIGKIKERSRITFSEENFQDIKQKAKNSIDEYNTGILFSTNKGRRIFYFKGIPVSGEIIIKELSAWCKANEINPEDLSVISIIHIKSYYDYLKQSSPDDPLSYIAVPTIGELKNWKIFTLLLTWALRQLSGKPHKEYDIKHLLLGNANGKIFFAGYENRISLREMGYFNINLLNPDELLRSGLTKFSPICIEENDEAPAQEGFIPDFMEKYFIKKQDAAKAEKDYMFATKRWERLSPVLRSRILKLFMENKKLINWVIKIHFTRFLYLFSYEELFSAGEKGLFLAARRFNPKLGYKFSSYAKPSISGNIQSYIKEIMRFYRNEITLSDYAETRDGEIMDLDRLGELRDEGPTPEEILIRDEEEGKETDRMKELLSYIKDPKAKLAFEIYTGIYDGEPHTLEEAGRIYFEALQTKYTKIKARLLPSTRARGAYTKETMSNLVENARKDILTQIYGAEGARVFLEAKKKLRLKKIQEDKLLEEKWNSFIRGGLEKEDWDSIVFTPVIKGTAAVFKSRGIPLFKFDIEYADNEVCMEHEESGKDKDWAIFRFICGGETIKKVFIRFRQGTGKKITYIPEYRNNEDIVNLAVWNNWVMQDKAKNATPKGRVRFSVQKIDNYPFADKGEIRFGYGKKLIVISIPKEYIGIIVTAEFSQGGKNWCIIKIFSEHNKNITDSIIMWDKKGKFSVSKINEKNLFHKSKLTDEEKKQIEKLLLEEITGGKKITQDILSIYMQGLKEQAGRIASEKRHGRLDYYTGEHWSILRKIEIIELYLKQLDASATGQTTPKSYKGKGGSDKEANPIIKRAFKKGAQDITNEQITMQAKAILLGDERFTEKDKEFADKLITFSGLRVIAVPGLALDGHYGMGGEVNNHTLPTIYIPKELYDYLLKRYNKGSPDTENAVWELADYLYHKYIEMRLVRLHGMSAEEAHKIADHSNYYKEEKEYIRPETYDNLSGARERLLLYIETRDLLSGYALEFVKWVLKSYPPETGKRYLAICQQGANPLGIMLKAAIEKLGWTHLTVKDIYINTSIAGKGHFGMGIRGVPEFDTQGSNTDEEIFRYLYQQELLDGNPLTFIDTGYYGYIPWVCEKVVDNNNFWKAIGQESKSIPMETKLLFYNYRDGLSYCDGQGREQRIGGHTYPIEGLNQILHDKNPMDPNFILYTKDLESVFPQRYQRLNRLIAKDGKLYPDLQLRGPDFELSTDIAEQAARDLVSEKIAFGEFFSARNRIKISIEELIIKRQKAEYKKDAKFRREFERKIKAQVKNLHDLLTSEESSRLAELMETSAKCPLENLDLSALHRYLLEITGLDLLGFIKECAVGRTDEHVKLMPEVLENLAAGDLGFFRERFIKVDEKTDDYIKQIRQLLEELHEDKEIFPAFVLAFLLHDYGLLLIQSGGNSHSVSGEKLLESFLNKLPLTPKQKAVIKILVGEHVKLFLLFFGHITPFNYEYSLQKFEPLDISRNMALKMSALFLFIDIASAGSEWRKGMGWFNNQFLSEMLYFAGEDGIEKFKENYAKRRFLLLAGNQSHIFYDSAKVNEIFEKVIIEPARSVYYQISEDTDFNTYVNTLWFNLTPQAASVLKELTTKKSGIDNPNIFKFLYLLTKIYAHCKLDPQNIEIDFISDVKSPQRLNEFLDGLSIEQIKTCFEDITVMNLISSYVGNLGRREELRNPGRDPILEFDREWIRARPLKKLKSHKDLIPITEKLLVRVRGKGSKDIKYYLENRLCANILFIRDVASGKEIFVNVLATLASEPKRQGIGGMLGVNREGFQPFDYVEVFIDDYDNLFVYTIEKRRSKTSLYLCRDGKKLVSIKKNPQGQYVLDLTKIKGNTFLDRFYGRRGIADKGKVIYSLNTLLESNLNDGKDMERLKALVERTRGKVFFYAGDSFNANHKYDFLKQSLLTTKDIKDIEGLTIFMLNNKDIEHLKSLGVLANNQLIVPIEGERDVESDLLLGIEATLQIKIPGSRYYSKDIEHLTELLTSL